MSYSSLLYFIFVACMALAYFVIPQRKRWIVLLVGSIFFIYKTGGVSSLLFIYGTAFLGWYVSHKKGELFTIAILSIGITWFVFRFGNFIFGLLKNSGLVISDSEKLISIAVPIGLSFYSLQVISYVVDVWKERIKPEESFWKFALYISWFPHILQGPIARYDKLSKSLYEGTRFEYERVTKGCQLIVWGLVKKLVIADRAGIFVDAVYNNFMSFGFVEIAIAVIFYGFQLYADFSGCVDISIGVSQIFGVELQKNFTGPYCAQSVKDFWRRWHLSLSSWLKDYVYISLGGNRNGKIRKHINLLATFLVSGLWHGTGFQYLFWGAYHGICQIVGDVTQEWREKHIKIGNARLSAIVKSITTFLIIDFGWLFFRAKDLRSAFLMIGHAMGHVNIWAFFNEDLYAVALDRQEFWLVVIGIITIMIVDLAHERNIQIRNRIAEICLPLRWMIYLTAIFVVIIFGEYGYGYNAAEFIYMQF